MSEAAAQGSDPSANLARGRPLRYDGVRPQMFVKRFFEPLIAQNSYLIGCVSAHEAIVIDPNRDLQPYLDTAEREGLRITHVTETHIHADFLSGARELAHRTGASLCLSDEGDQDWKYQFDHDRKLKHGDRITIGNVTLDVLHTPGHTPEHLTFLITDGAVADKPIAAVSGDFIFTKWGISLDRVELPSLTSVSGVLFIGGGGMKHVDLPELKSAGTIAMTQNSALETLTLPKLEKVDGELAAITLESPFGPFDMFSGELFVWELPQIESVALPLLTTAGSLNVSSMSGLKSLDAPL